MKLDVHIPEGDYWSLRNYARSNAGTPTGRVIGQVVAQLPVAITTPMPAALVSWLAEKPDDWTGDTPGLMYFESVALTYLAQAARQLQPPED